MRKQHDVKGLCPNCKHTSNHTCMSVAANMYRCEKCNRTCGGEDIEREAERQIPDTGQKEIF